MKITPTHFERLRTDCMAALAQHGILSADVDTMRKRWDVFHAANGYWLYKEGLDDAHIDTALRNIFKRLG